MSQKQLFFSVLCLWIGLATTATAQTVFTSVSSASYTPIVAPDSIASGFGSNLARTTASASATPLPTSLGNTQVSITDSAKNTVSAPLIYVSPTQINYIVPSTVALGKAIVNVTSDSGSGQGVLLVSNISPSFFTANVNGQGVPAAQIVRVDTIGNQTTEFTFQGTPGNYTPAPISLSPGSVSLVMWGTGFRRHSGNPVIATVKGMRVPVSFAGIQTQFIGLDQINIGPFPSSLNGAGLTNVVVTIDGIPANTLQIAIQ